MAICGDFSIKYKTCILNFKKNSSGEFKLWKYAIGEFELQKYAFGDIELQKYRFAEFEIYLFGEL